MSRTVTRAPLTGRAAESARAGALLDAARRGHGGSLLVTGEPGIGKTALVDAALAADDLPHLRMTAVESESTLPYAALHGLLAPALGRLDVLPAAQARALRRAFGLDDGDAGSPVAVGVAVLALLSALAADAPLAVVVDDLQWVDAVSLQVIGFVARRLADEPVALLLCAREDAGDLVQGVATLRLRGLDVDAARALLGERIDADAIEAAVRTTGGNPLALSELSGTLGAQGTAPVRIGEQLERAFLTRADGLPADARDLLVLAAADGTGRLAAVAAAARREALELDALDQAAALVDLDGDRLAFRHPLMRSAVYQGAGASRRRWAHRVLAAVYQALPDEADRRAWHLAAAATGPDETVAAALEATADRALRRAGPLAAADALARAADLTLDATRAGARLEAAADAAWRGGAAGRAERLLDRAEAAAGPRRPGIEAIRGEMTSRLGRPAAAIAPLQRAAAGSAATDPVRALRCLLLASEAAFNADDLSATAAIVAAAGDLPSLPDPPLRVLVDAFRALGTRTDPLDERSARLLDGIKDPELQVMAGGLLWGLGHQRLGRELRAAGVARARAAGLLGTLAWGLEFVAQDLLSTGSLAAADSLAAEGRALARETGRANSGCVHAALGAEVAALRGREAQARELADEALGGATDRGLVKAAGIASRALGLLELAAGRPLDALAAFDVVLGGSPVPGSDRMALTVVPDRVEAAVRAEAFARAQASVGPFRDWADRVGDPDVLALAARVEALTARDADVAGQRFQRALALHGAGHRPFEHARTALLYGERLRRDRRRGDARTHLRTAMETFARIGAPVWEERARVELRATGETARRRDPSTLDDLTAQERQIARAAAAGRTNKEIAAEHFLSPRTVDYHLRKVFRKLGIGSRSELMLGALDADAT